MNSNKHPILARGEFYISEIDKKYYGGDPKFPRSYDESKSVILGGLEKVQHEIAQKSEVFLPENVLCVRMEPKFDAKSYEPNMLESIGDIKLIGGRRYDVLVQEKNDSRESGDGSQPTASLTKAKLYFAKVTDKGLGDFIDTIKKGKKDNVKQWQDQLRMIRTIDLLSSEEKIIGFDDEWEDGVAEIVLHPYLFTNEHALQEFLRILNLKDDDYRIRGYKNGPVFCAARCTREDLERISRFNPLRVAHPLGEINLPVMRHGLLQNAPQIPVVNGRSETIVGVFDGGVDDSHPYLNRFTKAFDETAESSDDTHLSHGISVCGSVLYGALNNKSISDKLPVPLVSVESYRVLPTKKTGDLDHDFGLYGVIDTIEKIVTQKKHVKIFNLSFGPAGAIIDDYISRFTFALDRLSTLPHNPLFCVAAGNSGDHPSPLNRIQSPSDIVNGLGIGAYSFDSDNALKRAEYSCIGPGREGGKIKPDLVEFGGSPERPIMVLAQEYGKLQGVAGTSFASPIVAGKIGRIVAQSDDISPHLAKTLLIHNADQGERDINEVGFGFCPEDIDDVIKCTDKKVVILYEAKIRPRQNVAVPVLLPDFSASKGKVKITLTLTTLAQPNPNDVDSYTSNCIEEYFYPDNRIFNFTLRGTGRVDTKKARIGSREEQELLNAGYKKSNLPVTKSPKQFQSEEELRAKHLKWDTVIKNSYPLLASSLFSPFFVFHGMNRSGNDQALSGWPFYAIITVEFPKYPGVLYDDIVNQYRDLTPIRIKSQNQILVRHHG